MPLSTWNVLLKYTHQQAKSKIFSFYFKLISYIVLRKWACWKQYATPIFMSLVSLKMIAITDIYYIWKPSIFMPNFRNWCLDILAVISLDSKGKEWKASTITRIQYRIYLLILANIFLTVIFPMERYLHLNA